MGNDGGSIPKRVELVKEATRKPTTTEVRETQREQQAHLWTTCPLSHKPLTRPIVSDSGGNLYNKDAILQYLLPSEDSGINKEDCDRLLSGRVKSLKDVVEVAFRPDPSVQNGEPERFVCPMTGKQLGPAVKAVYIVPCGHAFSLEAVKEMKSNDCAECSSSYEPKDVIPILTIAEDDAQHLRTRIQDLMANGLTHSLKKFGGTKKRKAHDKLEKHPKQDTSNDLAAAPTTSADKSRSSTPQSHPTGSRSSNGIKNAATASLTAKVLREEEDRAKRRKMMGENETLKSLFSQSDAKKPQKDTNFMTRGYSIPANGKR
ncbi:MAG: hypothetical protein Q9160_001336 [Pyrenula sp. 1 TL-2023]